MNKPTKVNGQRIRCYDNFGKTCDRYTVAFIDQPENGGCVLMLGMSANPFHPQGFGQHTSGMIGDHLGSEIAFDRLPIDCQKLVNMEVA